jgi:hypothetical protein
MLSLPTLNARATPYVPSHAIFDTPAGIRIRLHLLAPSATPPRPAASLRTYIAFQRQGYNSLFAMQPFEPSDGCLALRKLMANG